MKSQLDSLKQGFLSPIPLVTGNQYIPHRPHPTQRKFLESYKLEVLFGGALGGGKSAALLMAALMYVHLPRYNAIIFRKTFADLNEPDALIDVSHQYLGGTDAKWNGQHNQWTFPSGAKLVFGHLNDPKAHLNYKGAQFQFIGFDEASDLRSSQMSFMITRLRKSVDNPAPLRIRWATNPGGISHIWLKDRFGVVAEGTHGVPTEDREFIPSKITDNPSLDSEDYIKSLQGLDPILREQLLMGKWSLVSGKKFKPEWIKRWSFNGDFYLLDGNRQVSYRHCRRIIAADIAGTQRDINDEKRGKESWTVILVWDITPTGDMCLIDGFRGQIEGPDVATQIAVMADKHRAHSVGIETDGIGRAVFQLVKRGVVVNGEKIRIPVIALSTGGRDKPTRFIPFQNFGESGLLYFPTPSPGKDWLQSVEDELYLWSGATDEQDDCIDTCGWSAQMVTLRAAGGNPRMGPQKSDLYGRMAGQDKPVQRIRRRR